MKQTDGNIVKISELLRPDRQLTRRMIADELDMSKETVRKILVQDLGMRRLATKLMPQNLMGEQKTDISLCARTLQNNFKKILFWIIS
jgi:orotate phosphoribosyltransferase-like protein